MLIQGFKPVINAHSRVLILGSIPSEDSLRKQEYYANPRNQFWRILDALFFLEDEGERVEPDNIHVFDRSYSQKLEFILQHKLALWDVIATCEREGSLDSHIKSPLPNSFTELFAQYPELQYLVFNGQKSFEVYRRQVGLSIKDGLVYQALPSTSPANTIKWERKLDKWKILRKWMED